MNQSVSKFDYIPRRISYKGSSNKLEDGNSAKDLNKEKNQVYNSDLQVKIKMDRLPTIKPPPIP